MKKVLIIDDDRKTRMVFKMLLNNYSILEAENGLEGVQMFKKHHPNIVLMDIDMPIMNGIAATKEILKVFPPAKIIVITAFAEINDSEILAAGARRIFQKPIRKSVLCNMLTEELAV